MLKKERYNITLNPKVIELIDHQACRLDMSRSALIDDILNNYIIENELFCKSCDSERINGQLEVI